MSDTTLGWSLDGAMILYLTVHYLRGRLRGPRNPSLPRNTP